MSELQQELQRLRIEIAHEGEQEEFYQRRGNYFMYDHHKNRRLILQGLYNEFILEGRRQQVADSAKAVLERMKVSA